MNPENTMNPNPNPAGAPVPPVLPAQPVPPAQPEPQPISPAANPAAAAAAQPEVPGMATLGVPMVSPTHFDNQNLAHPVVPTPGNPNANPVPPVDPTRLAAPVAANAEQTIKKFTTLSIIAGATAAVMLILAIVGMVMGISNGSKLAATEQELNNKIFTINITSHKVHAISKCILLF